MTISDAMIAITRRVGHALAEARADLLLVRRAAHAEGAGRARARRRRCRCLPSCLRGDLDAVAGRARGFEIVWIFASVRPCGSSTLRIWSTRRVLLQAERQARAALEVDAEVDPLARDRQRADQQDAAGHREEPLRLAHVVEAPREALLAGAERGACERMSRVRAQRVEDRLRGHHGGEQRHDDAEAEREREALDARRGEDEEDERDQERDDVRVDDRRQALAVARDDRLAPRRGPRVSPP